MSSFTPFQSGRSGPRLGRWPTALGAILLIAASGWATWPPGLAVEPATATATAQATPMTGGGTQAQGAAAQPARQHRQRRCPARRTEPASMGQPAAGLGAAPRPRARASPRARLLALSASGGPVAKRAKRHGPCTARGAGRGHRRAIAHPPAQRRTPAHRSRRAVGGHRPGTRSASGSTSRMGGQPEGAVAHSPHAGRTSRASPGTPTRRSIRPPVPGHHRAVAERPRGRTGSDGAGNGLATTEGSGVRSLDNAWGCTRRHKTPSGKAALSPSPCPARSLPHGCSSAPRQTPRTRTCPPSSPTSCDAYGEAGLRHTVGITFYAVLRGPESPRHGLRTKCQRQSISLVLTPYQS